MVVDYLKYKLLARHKNGFGVHSPFVFDLLSFVFFDDNAFYAFKTTEQFLQKTYGKSFNRHNIKYYRLIFRLANYFSAKKMLIVGKNPFIEKYFLSVSKKSHIVSLEKLENLPKENLPQTLSQNFKKLFDNEKNVPFDIIFFPTHNIIYYEDVIKSPLVSENSILIFEKFSCTKTEKAVWQKIVDDNSLKISIDIFKYGIVFIKKDFPKQHYLVKY
ncbi:MAG: hypothetical protein LBN95_11635 [Prevotellaceae bacterium]|jgi:hypothetical protein|nr:hypothetical protein [Prevotellaceae bacterium]